MRFSTYMLFEMGEIMSLDVSDIELSDEGHAVYCRYKVGEPYELKFVRKAFGFEKTSWGNPWYVDFKGPKGWNLTNSHQSHSVYTQFLKGFKAFLERYQPDGLIFSGYTSKQDIMYDVMMKKYLRPERGKPDYFVFYPIQEKFFISEHCIKSKSPEEQAELRQRIEQFSGAYQRKVDSYRGWKRSERSIRKPQWQQGLMTTNNNGPYNDIVASTDSNDIW